MVLRVNGMVGFVELGSTFGKLAARMMSGAWPPPAPSVWYVWMVRPLSAAMVSSTQPPSFRVSVWMATCTSISSATPRQVSITAGVAPQSSWIFRPAAPARICSRNGSAVEPLPLPRYAMLTGNASAASIIRERWNAPGEQVVALVPSAGPVPPPTMVVTPPASAVRTCCGAMKWMCVSSPPAVRMSPSPAMASVPEPTSSPGVTPSMVCGLPALPIALILPSLMPMSAL